MKASKRAEKANRKAAKGLKVASKELTRELKSMSKVWSDAANEIKHTNRAKAKELSGENKGIRGNFMKTLTSMRRTNMKDDIELTKQVSEVQMAKDGSKMAQDGHKMIPRWPRMPPTCPKDDPRWLQDGPR